MPNCGTFPVIGAGRCFLGEHGVELKMVCLGGFGAGAGDASDFAAFLAFPRNIGCVVPDFVLSCSSFVALARGFLGVVFDFGLPFFGDGPSRICCILGPMRARVSVSWPYLIVMMRVGLAGDFEDLAPLELSAGAGLGLGGDPIVPVFGLNLRTLVGFDWSWFAESSAEPAVAVDEASGFVGVA